METNYVTLLKGAFGERGVNNPSYSLRAFARDLNIDPGQLSRVFHGKGHLSHESAKLIAVKTFKKKKHAEYFVAMVDYCISKKEDHRHLALEKLNRLTPPHFSYKTFDQNAIHLIADWYNISILDLCSLKNFKPTENNISKYLGITLSNTKKSLKRLERSGLLMIENARWVKTHKHLKYISDIPSFAIRSFHKSMIEKALKSVEKQCFKERIIAGRTMTIKKEHLPQYEELINNFLEKLSDISTPNEEADSLYQLNIQLFNLLDSSHKCNFTT